MENTVKQTSLLERTGIFDEELKKRFELRLTYNGMKGKRALIIGMNPASNNIQVFDTTTNYILNNLGVMGYTDIVIWNLFADIYTKLKPSEIEDNEDNFQHLDELLKTKFDAIIIGYGNTYIGNRRVDEAKERLHCLLEPHKKNVYELIDKEKNYAHLKSIHPLFAGQRFSGAWELRKHEFPDNKVTDKKGEDK